MFRIAFLLLTLLVTVSCKNEMRKEFYPNGNLRFESSVGQNGLLEGNYTEYYDSGEVKSKGEYFEGSISDTVYTFYRNGNLKAKGFLNKNIKNGWWKYYWEDGKLKSLEEYLVINDSVDFPLLGHL